MLVRNSEKNKCFLVVVAVLCGLGAVATAAEPPPDLIWSPPAKLTASDGAADDTFGSSVSASGDYVIVGAPWDDHGPTEGSAYIFEKPATGWTNMTETAKRTPPEGGIYEFGWSVSISGDYALVGALGGSRPTAYIFEPGQWPWLWIEKARLTGWGRHEYIWSYGESVCISGDYAIVGAPDSWYMYSDEYGSGTAYVFKQDPVSESWVPKAKLDDAWRERGDLFGSSVWISGNCAIVGTPGENTVYVFKKPPTGWTDMTPTAALTASDGGGQFGVSVCISGDYVVVGAPSNNNENGEDAGAAYIFKKPATGWTNMTETAKLTAWDGAGGDRFGCSVCIIGRYAIIGAPFDDDQGWNSGSAYIFRRTRQASGQRWGPWAKLTAPDGSEGDNFGGAVSIVSHYAIVGAPGDNNDTEHDVGSVYVFRAPSVPNVSQWGLITMGLGLLTAGAIVIVWRKQRLAV